MAIKVSGTTVIDDSRNATFVNSTATGKLKLTGSSSGYVELQAASSGTNVLYTLPASDGLNGQVLQTNGVGSLTWVNQSAGGGGGSSGSGTSTSRTAFTATGGQTTFNVTYAVDQIDVYLNGSKLVANNDFYANTGNTIVLTLPAIAGDIIDTVVYSSQWITSSTNLYYTGGNIGVGTSSPAARIHLASANTAFAVGTLRLDGADGAGTVNAPVTINAATGGGTGNGGSQLYFSTREENGALTERFRIDQKGNLGLGVAPSDWQGTTSVFQNPSGSIYSFGPNYQIGINSNLYWNGSNWIYRATGSAGDYFIQNGVHFWRVAPSANTGNTATLSTMMRLNSTGLGIEINPSYKLDVFSSANTGNVVGARFSRTTANVGDQNAIIWQSSSLVSASISDDIRSSTNSDLVFKTAGSSVLTERMRIDSSGRVGIGTTSITGMLDIVSSTNQVLAVLRNTSNTAYTSLRLYNDTYSNIRALEIDYFGSAHVSGERGEIFCTGAYPLLLGTNNTERVRITSAGDVGIGTTSPGGVRFAVDSGTTSIAANFNSSNVSGVYVRFQNSGTSIGDIGSGASVVSGGAVAGDFGITSRSGALVFGTNTTERARIDSVGRLLIGTTVATASSNEKFEVYNGMTLLDYSDNSVATLYIKNRSTTPNTIQPYVYYTDGTGNRAGTGVRYTDSTRHEFSAGGTIWYTGSSGFAGERMRITSAGTVLIGSTTPRSTNLLGEGTVQFERTGYSSLQLFSNVASVDGSYIALWKARGGALNSVTTVDAGDIAGGLYYGGYNGTDAYPCAAIVANIDATPSSTSMPGRLVFQTTATGSNSPQERARITSGGILLVGTTSTPSIAGVTTDHAFVAGTGSRWVSGFRNTTTGTPWGLAVEYSGAAPNDTSSNFLYCVDNAAGTTLRASIRSNGGLANYQSNNVDLSDARTKKDITPAPSYWNKIGALEIVTYKYNDQTHDDVNVGVIAQQVEQVEPVWVDSDGFGETPEDGVPLKTVYTKDITFAAIKALQEAMQRIETLETELAAIKAKLPE